ncbi:sensor histidine kinase [Paenibacillus sp. GCM10027626]|uniref:sensor histidine kinase n=1 Tax=Paenibacillus sp. GCM10027626 TaxID=3273411 RepID=UPI0036445686
MKILNRVQFQTLRFKLMIGFMALVIPLVAFMIYNNMYAIQVVRNQVAQSNKNLISLYMGQIDRSLEEVEKYLYNIAALETGLLVLELPRNPQNDRYDFERIQLFNRLTKELPNYKSMDMFFVYSPANEDLMTALASSVDHSEFEAIQNSLSTKFSQRGQEGYPVKQWFAERINDQYYLARIIQYGGVYIGALGNAEKSMVPLNLLDLGNDGKAFLATDAFEPMANRAFIRDNNINLQDAGEDYNLTGKGGNFMVIGGRSTVGNFQLFAVFPDSVLLENLPFLRRIVSFISIGALVLLPLILYLFRRTVLLPIHKIITAMNKIQDGNLDVRIAHRPSTHEFQVMNQIFNRMISQIQELKVNVLEEQLNHQKAELRHLQLQINPHFFLNSLNIIYNLAQVQDYGLIQEMTHCLVQYFRFMFRSNLSFVRLKDEMEHTTNYLRIQEMRFPGRLTYHFNVPDELMNGLIPPLLVQTFVENTIKHAVSMDKQVHISIVAEETEDGSLHIRIEDTGKGFPPDVLAQLQRNTNRIDGDGRHIGIWNVQQRLRLLYKERAKVAFANGDNFGAIVDIRLPQLREAAAAGEGAYSERAGGRLHAAAADC